MKKTKALMICALFVLGCNDSSRMTPGNVGSGSADAVPLKAKAIRIIQEGLADDNPRVRTKAIEVVAATQQIQLMPQVQRLLRDELVPVRFAAALAMGDLKYRLGRSEVVQLLKDKDQNVRIAAGYAIAKLKAVGSFEFLHQAIISRDKVVRANAVWLAGKSGDKSALKPLYWALRDENSDAKVRLDAVEAIARLGDERIYPRLWSMLISAYADDRVMGISAMGALGTVNAQNALISMLNDDVLEVRLAAAEQLGALGDSTGEREVLDAFTKKATAGLDKEDIKRVNARAALAIGQIGTKALTKFLPKLLRSESKFVRIAAAKAVFQCINGKTAKQ